MEIDIMEKIKTTKTKNSKLSQVDWENLGFGKYFADHVFVSDFKDGVWSEGEILPYGNMDVAPGMSTLHYGQTIFEGLKAYRSVGGGVNLFRPDMNAKRMEFSAHRLVMPNFPKDKFIEAIKQLVALDKDWVPKKIGRTLYIRPLLYGSGNFLGVHASDEYRFLIMNSPVASYYPEGLKPVKILVSHEYVRAVRGGLGNAKTAANYAASLYAGKEAREQGFQQVLWLDGVERRYVDEVGAMNIMFVINDELVTPPLTSGSILPGVTRDSVLILAKQMGMQVSERPITIDEVFDKGNTGELQEAFGTGTAAVISPIGLLNYKGDEIIINNQKIGKYAQRFYDTLTDMQYGKAPDTNNWITHIDV